MNQGTMFVRTMNETDLLAVHRIGTMSLDETFKTEVYLYFMMQWPAGQLVACDMIGNVCGFLSSARLDNGRIMISLFAVDLTHRNKGVATELLSNLRRRAMAEGFRTLQLEVRVTNANAIRFYEKRGFMITERLPGFYNDGGDGVRMIASVMMNV